MNADGAAAKTIAPSAFFGAYGAAIAPSLVCYLTVPASFEASCRPSDQVGEATLRLRNPFVMIILAFGVGCSELPPSERRERRDEAAADAEQHQERRLISPVPISEQGDGGTGGEGERPQFD